MSVKFEITSDFEFYCYLKAHLPDGYSIVSEPEKLYYSEWFFNYKIYKQDKIWKEYSGNFNNLDSGFLVKEAKQLIKELEQSHADRQ